MAYCPYEETDIARINAQIDYLEWLYNDLTDNPTHGYTKGVLVHEIENLNNHKAKLKEEQ